MSKEEFAPGPPRASLLFQPIVMRRASGAPPAPKDTWLRQLFADELAHDRAVGATGDLGHHVRHHAPEVSQ